jgi:hypothetical protein
MDQARLPVLLNLAHRFFVIEIDFHRIRPRVMFKPLTLCHRRRSCRPNGQFFEFRRGKLSRTDLI